MGTTAQSQGWAVFYCLVIRPLFTSQKARHIRILQHVQTELIGVTIGAPFTSAFNCAEWSDAGSVRKLDVVSHFGLSSYRLMNQAVAWWLNTLTAQSLYASTKQNAVFVIKFCCISITTAPIALNL